MKKYIPPVFPANWTNSDEITSILYGNGWAVIQYRIDTDNFMARYKNATYWFDLHNMKPMEGSEALKHCIDTPLGVKAIPFEEIKKFLVIIETK